MIMTFATFKSENNQNGIALILAIGFLAVLSILGAVILNISTEDLKRSAVTRPDQESLYAADRAVEYAMNRDIIINLAQYNAVNLVDHVVKLANGLPASGNPTHGSVISGSGPGQIVSGTVTDIGPRTLPPAMAAIHGSEFGANLYHVNVETKAGSGVLEKTTHVDASIMRLFKLDDDQIFRTSAGG
jgi:hypothetical protein